MTVLSLSSPAPVNPWTEQLQFKTIKAQYEGGAVSAKQKWTYPRRNFDLKYKWITIAQAKTLYNFFIARAGSFGSFVIFLPFSDTYTGEYVGQGDSTTGSDGTSAFNAPGKTVSSYAVYVAGVEKTETTHYTIDATGGSDGEAEINFVSGNHPTTGQHITIDFTGYLKVRCKFGVDEMSFDNFYNTLVNSGIPLVGELNQ